MTLCEGLAISGACVGSYVWWRRPQSRLNNEEYLQYKAMLISLAVHLLLLMFELLTADNLDTRRHKVGQTRVKCFHCCLYQWILVFIPLVVVSIISIAICVWSVRHDRYLTSLF